MGTHGLHFHHKQISNSMQIRPNPCQYFSVVLQKQKTARQNIMMMKKLCSNIVNDAVAIFFSRSQQ